MYIENIIYRPGNRPTFKILEIVPEIRLEIISLIEVFVTTSAFLTELFGSDVAYI